jgi:hypothetical protein
MRHLLLVVVGKDKEATRAWVDHNAERLPDFVGVAIIENLEQRPLSAIGNSFLTSPLCTDVFGLIHADVFFDSPLAKVSDITKQFAPDLEILYRTAKDGKVCGIVGAAMDAQRYWWGHSLPDGTEHPVSCLDGSTVFFRRDLGLRFDEGAFDGFHCHVEDLCLQAHAKGIPVVVPAVKADHVGRSTYEPAWQVDYAMYKGRLNEKWAGKEFQTT